MQNASYSLNLTVPIVRCLPSNDTVRAWTAAAAYEAVTGSAFAGSTVAGTTSVDNSTFVAHVNNLTYTVMERTNFTDEETGNWTMVTNKLFGQIGYYGMLGNTTMVPNGTLPGDLWIAIANVPNGTTNDNLVFTALNRTDTEFPAIKWDVSYFTCSLWNVSVPTNVTFVDNVQSLQAGPVRMLDFFIGGEEPEYVQETDVALETYNAFGSVLYGYLLGYVANFIEVGDSSSGSGSGVWNTTIDDTILGTAADFSAITMAWQLRGYRFYELGATVQKKNLTTLIEDLSLNASLSLMSNPIFK